MPDLNAYLTEQDLDRVLTAARLEDLGPAGIDVTSHALIPDHVQAAAHIRTRQPGTIAGLATLPQLLRAFDTPITCAPAAEDGDAITPGQTIATFTGPLRDILLVERTALNLLTHLSGIATLTQQFVQAAAGTQAKICDTRKTLPGLRGLQKYAVSCGGGTTHRIGLFDAVLIKDNHLAHIPAEDLTDAVRDALAKARTLEPHMKFAMVEVDTLDQLQRVLPAGPDLVLLDNMGPDTLRQAVSLRNQLAPGVLLEASGGINLSTTAAIAATGVDRLSVGQITHSAPSLDLGLDINPS